MADVPGEGETLLEVSERIRSRRLSPVELTRHILGRIQRLDVGLQSYNAVVSDHALERAREAEAEIARGLHRGPLHGVPLAVKDLIDTTFAPTSAGMHLRRDVVPAANATVVDRLESAGAIILGKLAMTEGAYFDHHPKMPHPRNPWRRDYWTGVSSSGCGVATAAGLCYGSLGSDTGGSIRLPSSACGLTGLKPTWGRVSRFGVFPLAHSLDTVGPMARNAADAAAILCAIAGSDPRDPTALQAWVPDYLMKLSGGIRGVRIGFDDTIADTTDPQIMSVLDSARDQFLRLGVRIVRIKLPSAKKYLATSHWLTAGETALAHRDTFPSRESEYGDALAARLKAAHAVTSVEAAQSNIERLDYAGRLAELFEDVDLLLIPVLSIPVPKLNEVRANMGRLVRFTAPFNATGSPTITLQGGFDDEGLPVGFQLVGRHLSEDLLLRAGHSFQQATDWHKRWPPLEDQ